MSNPKYDCAIVGNIPVKRFADLILDIGTFLLASGAHSGRVKSNITRMAVTWGFDVNLQPTFKGLLVTVKSHCREDDTITMFKESPTHVVHLEVLTRVSHLSWKVYEENLSIEETENEFDKIKNMPHYNPWIVSVAVGFSCAGLCFFAFGDIFNALVAMCGAFMGSLFRYKIAALKYNQMISISIAAFITTMITGGGTVFGIGSYPEAAMATAVLYLIPGVPLINSVIDLIEGYLSSAVNRALFAGFILLCIAAGMTLSITLLGIENFKL
ncbi:uncharacterized membrane protein YjjP (DUF1212 family) [Dysgonomonas alginatilytica]|uniref:Uncharacterized membrane protein YjjP (DUF1212 family) n=1 Tax=Dysgonomonas alginatilytica TaxID=1605892 RepID=A0A2V3PVL3_9BACT|nr:threonine/serine exporter family protein [Dysgonomonas alginatilytica]PXV68861.1 uncharacterized membrane protein YjjP (DUF1212 family) [Dysgonomonas alginatilytica]